MTAFSERYRRGVNLGGWLSQYGTFDHEHFERFVDRSDIERIDSWGLDHVRLPVDYPVLLDDSGDGYDERGFGYVDRCIEWCREHDLGVVIDLHKAPGYSFNEHEGSQLFDEGAYQDRFVDLWTEIAGRYDSVGNEVAFELLNEVVDPPGDAWNDLAERTIDAIRAVDPDRTIVVGGPDYNAVDRLEDVRPFDDDNVVYTFHFYEPKLFTHQHASWMDVTTAYDADVEYPGTFPELDAFLEEHPSFADGYGQFVDEHVDREWIERAIEPALAFRDRTGATVYCGEFGVIDHAPAESRAAWHRDVVDVLAEHDVGRAVWSYKEMSFGLLDGEGTVVDEDVLDAVTR